jgi:hypothetical protein
MNLRILAIVLLVLGTLALIYRGFSYTKETHNAKVGPLELQVNEKEHVDVPVWAGVAAIAVGGAMLVLNKRR